MLPLSMRRLAELGFVLRFIETRNFPFSLRSALVDLAIFARLAVCIFATYLQIMTRLEDKS
jgi:hypothetical protein